MRPGSLTKRPGIVTERPGILAKHPGILARRPGSLAKRPGTLTSNPGIVSKRPGCVNAQFLKFFVKNMNPGKERRGIAVSMVIAAKVNLNIYTPESPAFINQSFFYEKKNI
jgi:hypothetical protein